MFIRMPSTFIVSALAAIFLFFNINDVRSDEAQMSDARKTEIEKLIHDYIMANPEVILDAVRAHQVAEEARQQDQREQKLISMRDQLENSATSPIAGNTSGDVTVVEFFDYRCGYCKHVHDTVIDTVKGDGKVRLVYKEYPVLGPDSVAASRAALGVFFTTPEKYVAFHDALMRSRGGLNEAKILEIAATIGLDPEAVKKNMTDPRVDAELHSNMALAEALNIRGTPAFVVDQTIVPGALDAATLKAMISKSREG